MAGGPLDKRRGRLVRGKVQSPADRRQGLGQRTTDDAGHLASNLLLARVRKDQRLGPSRQQIQPRCGNGSGGQGPGQPGSGHGNLQTVKGGGSTTKLDFTRTKAPCQAPASAARKANQRYISRRGTTPACVNNHPPSANYPAGVEND